MHPAPTLLLLTGPPGTGKSSLAEHAADRLDAAVLGWDWAMADLEDPRRVRQGYIEWRLNDAQVRAFEQEQRDHFVASADIVSSREQAAAAITGVAAFIDRDYDVSFDPDETSCRVPRTLVVDGMSAVNQLRRFWKEQIAAVWNRPGFEIRPRFIRCEQAPKGTADACDFASAGRYR